ncbi:hypothetical protein FCH32_08805 [Citrobacter gillenii]|uniref:Uncharacterized protein n=1 Tax=Citrobacter gillenii TaxID=67828 RepID=A0ABD6M0H3_9ENTR|nr:hypothetical protein [Citrobacter gillenii]TKU17779.1 hypothetical protein FDW88_03960 [Citrobacter sp. wls829]
MAVIGGVDFWIKRNCNTMRISHDGYSREIVTVISDAEVLVAPSRRANKTPVNYASRMGEVQM